MTQSVVVMVAAHKQYEFPDDMGFLPIHVGKALTENDLGIQGDNTGSNISHLNQSFCELTGLYWLWKNVEASYYGLSHYRRYFTDKNDAGNISVKGEIISSSEFLSANVGENDVILAKKRCYVIDTVRSHYNHAHYASDLEILEKVIVNKYPDYHKSYQRVMSKRCLSLYNMFFMRKDLFFDYMDFLFDVLFELEKQIPYKKYGPYQKRVFGFMGERLLNIWIENHKETINVRYSSVVNIEGDSLIGKVIGVLKRKYLGFKMD